MKQLSHFLVFSGIFVILLIVFQNCAEPLSEDDELASVAAAAPFAYDSRVDTIAHLSCNYSNASDVGSYYTFRAGAYRSGSGLRYTDAFISATGGYSPEKRAQVLAHTDGQNANQAFVLGVLYRANLDNTGILGAFSPVFSSPSVALALPQSVGNSNRVNVFNGQYLSTSFLLPTQNVAAFRSLSQMADPPSGNPTQDSRVILAQYYSNDGQQVAAGDGIARGNAYYIDFLAPGHISNAAQQAVENHNLVADITEKTLAGREGNVTGLWSCERYLIVRNLEQGYNYTSDNPAGDTPRFNELRQLLPASAWYIDLSTSHGGTRGHIVPRQASCYGNNINQGPTQQGIVPHYPGIAFAGDCTNNTNTCPHYFTVCKRE